MLYTPTPADSRLLAHMSVTEPLSTSALALCVGALASTVGGRLARLARVGLVERVYKPSGRQGPPIVSWLLAQ